MKHILLVHQAFVSPHQAGGTRHYEFAKLLAPLEKYHFTIIASTVSYLTGQNSEPRSDDSLEPSIRVLRAYTLPVLHRSLIWRVIAFFSFMFSAVWTARQAHNIDLVMGTTPPIFQAVSAWFISLIRRKPFLLEVRDLWPEFIIGMGALKNPVLIRLSRWLESFLYSRANHIVVNSPAYRDYMLKRGIPAHKVSLIPNGVDPEMFNVGTNSQEMRRKLGLENKFVVTYAGALGQANDIGTILRAARILKKRDAICFLLVGDGKEKSNLLSIASEYELDNVMFIGALPKLEMPAVLAASDVCVATLMDIPMFTTTYPNKVFDYMAAGKATILGIDGVIRDVVEAAQGGVFFKPGDSEALAEVIETLHDNSTYVAQMGSSARSYVIQHFNRQVHVRDFASLIDILTIKQ